MLLRLSYGVRLFDVVKYDNDNLSNIYFFLFIFAFFTTTKQSKISLLLAFTLSTKKLISFFAYIFYLIIFLLLDVLKSLLLNKQVISQLLFYGLTWLFEFLCYFYVLISQKRYDTLSLNYCLFKLFYGKYH